MFPYLKDEAIKMAFGLRHKLLDAAVTVPLRRGIPNLVSVVDLKDDCLDQASPSLVWTVLVGNIEGPMEL